ncbi:hypothetical protein PPROV_000852300 [Pycnococcus provasolii]|uniref:Small ubiquitin-related modifier n=1 Tax=Pycnococcus provasolii TaxID=41880 RepID=A0A830HS18_9CHLO|nr:hypothetical protein PPROV_000852300 [Pycnococcus provasolii]|eukprot:CAMPEP_0206120368 /NCGR_PEP_ID=MMETSP1472-20131121/501_1 /ASSEMBLY_ACC=CAM_ASM_001108 /TAXON_ID=41880 /ORGANISM="Pycnococcus provasolii, Strain RCC251" /LENGTH=90 /DNA_ID=CAMNT_0053510453 /DNA_START=53 /DNA_END=325 /DNA_ORIENTATION=+
MADAPNDGQLQIKVKAQDGSEMFFKVKPSTKMGKVFAAYASKKSVEQRSVKFLFDGNRIKEDDTPESLGLENDDEVDAMLEMVGGHFFDV